MKLMLCLKIKSDFIILLSAIMLILFIAQPLSAENEIKEVLVLFPFYETRDWDTDFMNGFLKEINEPANEKINFTVEYLEMGLIPINTSDEEIIKRMQRLEEAHEFDIIISVFPTVNDFLLQYEDRVFTTKKKIFVPVSIVGAKDFSNHNSVVSVSSFSEMLMKELLNNIRLLIPELRNLIVIHGSGEGDISNLNNVKQIINTEYRDLEIEYYSGLPCAELISKVDNLPENSAILFMPYFRDKNGKVFIKSEYFPELSNKAKAPIFSYYDALIGIGVLGGVVPDAVQFGQNSARNVLAYLLGRNKQTSQDLTYLTPIYDWRQLKRWDIAQKLLPKNSVIVFQPESPLQKYKREIIAILCFISVETVMILALLLTVKKKRKAAAI